MSADPVSVLATWRESRVLALVSPLLRSACTAPTRRTFCPAYCCHGQRRSSLASCRLTLDISNPSA
jgi:hypothetical protein